jgi:hypothetical protein
MWREERKAVSSLWPFTETDTPLGYFKHLFTQRGPRENSPQLFSRTRNTEGSTSHLNCALCPFVWALNHCKFLALTTLYMEMIWSFVWETWHPEWMENSGQDTWLGRSPKTCHFLVLCSWTYHSVFRSLSVPSVRWQ